MNRLACAPITVQRLENKNNEYSGSDVNQVDLNRLDASSEAANVRDWLHKSNDNFIPYILLVDSQSIA